MRRRRRPCRWWALSRSRSLALLLPVIEFRLLILLVLGILLHRRSGFYQGMSSFVRGWARYRTSRG
jgi:hypothetical protein